MQKYISADLSSFFDLSRLPASHIGITTVRKKIYIKISFYLFDLKTRALRVMLYIYMNKLQTKVCNDHHSLKMDVCHLKYSCMAH